MRVKRQLFRPGRNIERIAKLADHPFFSRRGDVDVPGAGIESASASRRPWSARIAEHAGALFSVVVSVVLAAAVVALVVAFVIELRRDTVVLEAFSAPRDLVEQGYTSTAIAEKMLDEIRAINAASNSTRARRSVESGASLPDIEIAHSGVSMKAIVRYARRLLGTADPSISGEIVRRDGALRMTIRTRDRDAIQVANVARSDNDADALLRDAGRTIFQATDPYVLATYIYDGESNAGSQAFPETLAAIDYVLSHPPASDDAWALMLRGNVRMDQGRFDDAIADYRAAQARDASIARGNLALAMLGAGRRDEALAYTRDMLSRRDSTPAHRADLGWVLLRDGDVAGARELALQLLARHPSPPIEARGLVLLAGALNLGHRQTEALDVLDRYERLRVADADVLILRTHAYATLGKPERAAESAQRLFSMQPDSAIALRARGYAQWAARRYDEAIADFERAIEKSPSDGLCPLAQIGDIRVTQQHYVAAIEAYRRHEQAARKYGFVCAAQAQFGWARALDATGKPGEAVARFAAAAARDPDDVALWQAWAATLDSLGRRDAAAAKRAEAARAEERLKVPLPLE